MHLLRITILILCWHHEKLYGVCSETGLITFGPPQENLVSYEKREVSKFQPYQDVHILIK